MKKNTCLLFILSLLIIFSCKPQVPGKYLQPDEFEDILYDYHIADAMAGSGEAEDTKYEISLYRQAVLKKHDITQAEFDSSLVYYIRHADRLHKIYENLSKRLSDEALALGASANDISRYGDMTSVKDTSNMWRGVPSCILMQDAPYNVMSFDIAADSTYHKGDKLIFSFNTNFIFKDGIRDCVAMLAIQFKNDSIANSVVHVSSNSNYSITVSDVYNNGIKAIRGFIYLNKSASSPNKASLSLMAVNKIKLIRMRNNGLNATKKTDDTKDVSKDSLKRDNNILKKDNNINSGKNSSLQKNTPPPAKATAIPVQSKTNAPIQTQRILARPQRLQAE